MPEHFDAIVVGAGPAGSTAARELAAAGARVLLLDREHFPRYKACGGGIPRRTARVLPFPLDPVVEDEVSLLDIAWRGRCRFVRDSGEPFAAMVMRDRFDALLLDYAQRAGAEFRQGSPVRTLEAAPAGVSVTTEGGFSAGAQFLIAADGAHSPVGKMAGLGAGLAECAAYEVEVRAPAHRVRANRATAFIELGFRPWGYAWVFPKAEVLSVGIVLPPDQAGTMKQQVSAYLQRLGLGGAPVDISRGHKIRFRRGAERIADDRVLLAGDAAGLADEFTQEGIFYAIESGRIAARAVLRALAGQAPLFAYQRDIDRELMPELRAARLIAHMFYGMLGRFPGPWLLATRALPYLWDAFFAVQRGESTYAREVHRVPILPAMAQRRLAQT
ncbi:MAG: hyaluronate lyase [Tepidiforma sp.]|nr:MAG: hyaluronate lyase [Tepidiforma sp.]